jgi:hypothetical protein
MRASQPSEPQPISEQARSMKVSPRWPYELDATFCYGQKVCSVLSPFLPSVGPSPAFDATSTPKCLPSVDRFLSALVGSHLPVRGRRKMAIALATRRPTIADLDMVSSCT